MGVVVDFASSSEFQIKPILNILDDKPILTQELIELAKYLASSTFCTFYQSLKAIMPSQALSKDYARPKMRKYVRRLAVDDIKLTDKQQ